MSESITVGMRAKWQDGAIERIGWVGMIFASGKVYIQDEANYTHEVDVSMLTPAPITPEERATFDQRYAEWKVVYSK